MNLKGILVCGVAVTAVVLGSHPAQAWPLDAPQRGWVDSVSIGGYPDWVVGPTSTVRVRGWACVRPDLPDYGVPPTQVIVYQNGVRQTILPITIKEERPDVYNAGYCRGSLVGFSVWIVGTSTAGISVTYDGPYGPTPL